MRLRPWRWLVLGVWVSLLWIDARAIGADSLPRISIENGKFVEKGTGKRFVPLGCNFIHLDNTGKHATFCPGVYDAAFVERMMDDLSAHGLNTVRTFQAYAVGENGIVQSKAATQIAPGYLVNMIDFLKAARRHRIHVIFTTDTWLPDSSWLANGVIMGENHFRFSPTFNPDAGTNNYFTALPSARTRVNQAIALIRGIRAADPDLLKVVLSWEIQNEACFDAAKYPLTSRDKHYEFAGRSYDLSTNKGQQDYMDDVATVWCNFNVRAVQEIDPDALVSLSFFAFSCVGRSGPGHLLEDKGRDHRVPVRPMALLKSKLSYIDFHLYAYKSGKNTFEQDLEGQLSSDECPALIQQAEATQKPILVGETGLASKFMIGSSDRAGIHYNFDVGPGLSILREHLLSLKRDGFSGALLWHYGWQPARPSEEFPTLITFPELEDIIRSAW